MKKGFLVMIFAGLLALMLTACGGNGAAPPGASAMSVDPDEYWVTDGSVFDIIAYAEALGYTFLESDMDLMPVQLESKTWALPFQVSGEEQSPSRWLEVTGENVGGIYVYYKHAEGGASYLQYSASQEQLLLSKTNRIMNEGSEEDNSSSLCSLQIMGNYIPVTKSFVDDVTVIMNNTADFSSEFPFSGIIPERYSVKEEGSDWKTVWKIISGPAEEVYNAIEEYAGALDYQSEISDPTMLSDPEKEGQIRLWKGYLNVHARFVVTGDGPDSATVFILVYDNGINGSELERLTDCSLDDLYRVLEQYAGY